MEANIQTSTVPFLTPEIFRDRPALVAGFSTRHGGVSPAPYDALNLGLSTGDTDAHVLKNRRRLFEQVGFSLEQLAIAGQVHGARVKEVTEPGLFKGYDAMVTRQAGILLCISAADCTAVLLADAEASVIGGCHSGWRGTAAGITRRTLSAMQQLGAEPERTRAYISPCISVDHFEVGPEVADQFDAAFVHQPTDGARPHVNLKAAIASQLREAGLASAQIETDPRCTVEDAEDFYSYRAKNGKTGRMMGFIGRQSP